jgi:UMF1 family MFS transporter
MPEPAKDRTAESQSPHARKAIWGWALYDWANSAFATSVMAGFFPIFFKQYWSLGADVSLSTARLGFGNALASLLIATVAPVMGAIADRGSARKKFLITFAYLGVLMTALLYVVGQGQWLLAITVYVAAAIGFSGSIVFYDSLLPGVASEKQIDFVSSLGYSLGYLGGGLLFLLNVIMTLAPGAFGLPDASAAVRISFVLVALWWGLFSLFTVFWVPDNAGQPRQPGGRWHTVMEGLQQLAETFKEIKHLRTVFLFLLAYWFYIDGVDTIIRMAVDYGLSLGFHFTDLITALLVVQFVGFPAALAFGKLGQKWGVRRSIFLAIGMYIGITLWGTMISNKAEFYALAVMIALVQGGIQALSRSYYSRLIPANKAAQYYGFYNMLGKFAAIIGPALMGGVVLLARHLLLPPSPTAEQILATGRLASRWSLGSIIVLFAIGGLLLYFVDEQKGRREAQYLSTI